jgi:hypothetical protein
MSVVADVSIRAEAFLLGRVVAECPEVSVEVERVVPARNQVMPYVWVYGEQFSRLEGALSGHDDVRSFDCLDRLSDRALYRIEWVDQAEELVSGLVDVDATILRATSDDEWLFRIRFEEHSGLARFDRHCADHGVDYRLDRVSSLSDSQPATDPYGLTKPQYDALRLALERGYFRVPREVTFEELSEELDVSVQAISERIRRGADSVLEEALLYDSARSPGSSSFV